MIKNMRAIPPWEKKEATKEQYDKLRGGESKKKGTLGPVNPGMKPHGPVLFPAVQDPLPKVEIEKRLGKLEKEKSTSALIEKVGDQYQYTKEFVYLAYASALANLSSGSIANQSDATNFQFSPFSDAGTLMPYRGFFTNKSIHQSGDPTDYTWQSTSGMVGYTSSQRYYTVSTKRLEELGSPTKPGTGVTWVVINAGSGIPSAAIWFAERFQINSIWNNWSITAVGPWVGSDFLVDGAIIEAKIAANAITVNKILNGAIQAGKIANNAVTADTIAANSIVAGKIATNAITAGKITAGAIDASKIAANAITANAIAANAITSGKISATTKITAGTGNNIGVLDGGSNTGNYRIYAGHATPGSAPFRVDQAGVVTIDSGGTSKLVISGDTLEVFNSGTLRVKIGNLA
tara:strand:+ start:203 stop:1417 length:1215 start_codon:yes stop_codon:yes gene_type:complete